MSQQRTVLERYPEYEAVIGMEVHVQLTTKSKIFCTCPNDPSSEPNTNICQICAGYPGVLPQLNEAVIEFAIKAGIATNSVIAPVSEFDRKHYFYPDLPKGFQTTQQFRPVCTEGHVPIRLEDGSIKKVRLNRIHIEEDAGKNIHSGSDVSFVDLNRAGTPLLEIVSYPDINSSTEVRAYLKWLHSTVQYLGICTGNMEEGAFRADTNISVRKKGDTQLGTKCELKNINSFKYIVDATEHEIERQILLLENGQKVRQETRLWDSKARQSIIMRTKEEAADYRFFNEPDLPLVVIDEDWIDRVRKEMPELPDQLFERLCASGLSAYEATILVDDRDLARYYQAAAQLTTNTSLINWVLRDVMGYLKEHKLDFNTFKITPAMLAQLMDLLERGTINSRVAQEIFQEIAQTGAHPADVVKDKGLEQMQNTDELEAIIKAIVDSNPAQVAGYKSGKDKLFGFFVGQAMQKTQGKANPVLINELLKKYLS